MSQSPGDQIDPPLCADHFNFNSALNVSFTRYHDDTDSNNNDELYIIADDSDSSDQCMSLDIHIVDDGRGFGCDANMVECVGGYMPCGPRVHSSPVVVANWSSGLPNSDDEPHPTHASPGSIGGSQLSSADTLAKASDSYCTSVHVEPVDSDTTLESRRWLCRWLWPIGHQVCRTLMMSLILLMHHQAP